jgi:26S proteasome regulatory subunit N3
VNYDSKAPQGYAYGFTNMVQKLIVIVQLLMGEIPERSLFNQVPIKIILYAAFLLHTV